METIDIAALPICAGDKVLDLGCGEGRHTIALHYHFPEALVAGLDLSVADIQCAQAKHKGFVASSDSPSLYVCGDGYALPFSDNYFDHIICSEVLEHLDDYQQALSEIERTLKPGGSLSISIPRAWPERICWWLSAAYYNVEGGHVRIFNSAKLSQEIQRLNFNFRRKHYAHALHSPYWWLKCLVWREDDRQPFILARWYHRLLVWDLLSRPRLTRYLEACLNPFMGKSTVLYFDKKDVS